MIRGSSLFFTLAVSATIVLGCHPTDRLVEGVECAQGDTRSCDNPNGCGVGTQTCSAEGQWEECTNIDYTKYDHKQCYTGPDGTNWVGVCHSGYEVCDNGKPTCMFQQTPQLLNCENGADNDCNGKVDINEFPNQNPVSDLVMFLDESGSMAFVLPIVMDAVSQFAQASNSHTQMRIALVGVPHNVDGQCGVITDFKTPAEIPAVLNSLNLATSQFSAEPSLDCPYLAADPTNPFHLSYRPNAVKTFISFTDEIAQSYLDPKITAVIVGTRLADEHIKFYSFDSTSNRFTFAPIIRRAGGRSIDLYQSAEDLLASLLGLFSQLACGG